MTRISGGEPDPKIPTYTWTEKPGFGRWRNPGPMVENALERGTLRLLNDDEVATLLANGGLTDDERVVIAERPSSEELFYASNFSAGIDAPRGSIQEQRAWQPWAQRLAILYSRSPTYVELFDWVRAGYQVSANAQLSGILDDLYVKAMQLVGNNDPGVFLADGSVNQFILLG